MRFTKIIAAFSLLGALSGCVHEREGPPKFHYQEFKTRAPTERTVFVCSAYGCKEQTPVKFGPEQMAEIAALMKKTKKADTPHEERRAVAYAVAWAETYAGKIAGTSADRPGMEFAGSGDPTQQDCVDEATNTTSYMLMLEKAGLDPAAEPSTWEEVAANGQKLKAAGLHGFGLPGGKVPGQFVAGFHRRETLS